MSSSAAQNPPTSLRSLMSGFHSRVAGEAGGGGGPGVERGGGQHEGCAQNDLTALSVEKWRCRRPDDASEDGGWGQRMHERSAVTVN